MNIENHFFWECPSWMFPKRLGTLFNQFQLSVDQSALSSSNIDDQVINHRATFDQSCLLIANCQLPSQMQDIWNHCGSKFCVDGGANRLYDWASIIEQQHHFLPKCTVGDLDSIRDDVRKYYSIKGVEMIHNHSQDTTDLDKTLEYFYNIKTQSSNDNCSANKILIVGALGGNLSQELANFNACWKYTSMQILFAGENNIVCLLHPGKHTILSAKGLKCGIIPLGSPCEKITTTGLKWNLNDDRMEFGKLISSSNVTMDTEITIQISHPVLWTFDFTESS